MTTARKTDDAPASLGLLAHLARVARHEVGSTTPSELGAGQFVVLTALREHGAATQRALAAALRLDPSSMVGILNDLEERGLVARRRDPSDRRRHIVELQDLGRRHLADAEAQLAPAEDRVLHALSTEERRTLHALLTRAVSAHAPADASCVPAPDGGAAGE
jgi:DNA-binding MarR family transcriptional regulator